MVKKNIIGLIILISITCKAQDRNSIWAFGDSAGIDFSNNNNPLPITTAIRSRGSCASISDTSGNLLFSTNSRAGMLGNTTLVWDKNNNLLQSGDSIVGQAWYHELTIIPQQNFNGLYYLLCAGELNTGDQGLYYSLIDMSQNGGLGVVIQKNIQINSFSNADCVTSIKHGNGRDWWLISKENNTSTNNNLFYIYLINNDSIFSPIILQFNNAADGGLQSLSFNQKGNKLMQLNRGGFMCEYDFDRCSGIISNPKIIYPQQTSNFNRNFFNGTYSSNDSLFYISSSYYTNLDTSYLIQYNLIDSDIAGSADTIGRIAWPVQGGAVKLAPDGKIYYTCFYDWGFPGYPYPDTVYNQYNMNLGVINYPDNLGSACDYQPFSFYLGGKRTYYGIPNNPNYELSSVAGSICDSITNSNPSVPSPAARFFVFYHPSWQKAYINAQYLKGKNYSLQVYDLLGKVVYSEVGKLHSEYFTKDLNCDHFGSGMYVITLQTEEIKLSKKFVIE